ncbi:MAG: outer membrane lipoprotein carrier protein LolA [Planctomycetota bacterium]
MGGVRTKVAWVLAAGWLLTQAGGMEPPATEPKNRPETTQTLTPKAEPPTAEALAAAAAFEKRLVGVDAKMAAVADLRADFEQTKKTALLKKPLVSRGTLVCKGETVLWSTTSPRRSDMLVGGGKVTVYYPDDALAEVYSMGAGFRDAAGGPLPRLMKLKDSFDFAELDAKQVSPGLKTSELKGRIALKLTPRSGELKQHVASVRVLIDESVPCADRMVIVDPDGDETELRFTSVKINTGMKDAELELKLPEGTRVSTPVETRK